MKTITQMRQELAAKAADDEAFRSSLIADPKSVISKEYGLRLADNVKITVHEDSALSAHLILPSSPELSHADLERVVGGSVANDYEDFWNKR